MRLIKRGLGVISVLVAMAVCCVPSLAQLVTTTIQDTVYHADGTPAGGSVVISWSTFTTQAGAAIAAGTKTVTLGSGGSLSVSLAPNAGATPMGTYYTVVYHLDDGTTTNQYWSVPQEMAGSAPLKLSAVSTTVLPASVAVQTASKQYVDNAIAAAQAGVPLDTSPYVMKSGDTMTGPLVLPGDPVSSNQAADMHYVDSNIAAIAGGINTKVSTVPGVTQVVSQPSGTQLEVNNLNGELYATQYQNGPGNNGVANAASSADCVNGCTIRAEPTYPATESTTAASLPQKAQVLDERGGAFTQASSDPLPVGTNGQVEAMNITNKSTRTASQLSTLLNGGTLASYAQTLTEDAVTGGNNQFPEASGSGIPYFKSTYGVELLTGNYNSAGQKVQFGNVENCYGIGDCISGAQYMLSYGGLRDSSDEGVHPWELIVSEAGNTFTGTCTSGCTTGSTQVVVAASIAGGTQGEGRYLIDTNPAKTISVGQIVGGGEPNIMSTADFSGTNFPLSTFFITTAGAFAQPHNMAPGTVTLPIVTSGLPSGYATNTAVIPASGVACLAEVGITNFEIANYTVVDGSHLQVTVNKVHSPGTTIAVGGMCGYGLEQMVDTAGPIRQIFPVLGSTSPTQLSYMGFVTGIVGVKNKTGGYLHDTFSIASIARSGNVVTATLAAPMSEDVNGLTMTIAGVADSSYNGSYVVTTTSATTLTYTNTGANSTSNGGTVSINTGSYALYPMAEVLGVMNPATKQIDGTLTLGANNAPWAPGDTVEEPHYYLNRVAADVEYITQYEPRPLERQSAGKTYEGRVGPQLYGWEIVNAAAATDYLGSGGTRQPPAAAYSVLGEWANDMELQAGDEGAFRIHCGARGCGRWDSGYGVLQLDSVSGVDGISFTPYNDTMTNIVGGTSYSFSPSAFTAPTINVGTLNATTISGGFAASAITSGTIAAARLPVFGPSGATHAVGAVPDPGATAGATRFLREDGTWSLPAGGSGTAGNINGGAAYQIPEQVGPGSTSFVNSPSTAGTYMLSKTLTGSSDVGANWTNVGTLLASPPAIGGTTPNTGTFSALNATTTSATGAQIAQFLGPNMTGINSVVSMGFGKSLTSGNSVFLAWWGGGFGSFETFAGQSPIRIGATYAVSSGPMIVDTGDANGTIASAPAAGTALAINNANHTTVASVSTSGVATLAQVVASGAAPAVSAGAAAGGAASCSAMGSNMAGVVTCATGSGTSASATLATVAFNGVVSTAPQGCSLMPRNAAAASVTATVYTSAPTTTGWSIGVGATAVAASTTYSWSYSCL